MPKLTPKDDTPTDAAPGQSQTNDSREARSQQIDRDARSIIASEKASTDAKTARLRALRLAQEGATAGETKPAKKGKR